MPVSYHTIDQSAYTQRLDNYLIKHLKGVPKSLIHRVIRKGNVRVNKGRKKADYKLELGDVVRIPPIDTTIIRQPRLSSSLEKLLASNIIFEDAGLIVLNKPSGVASHGGSGIDMGAIEALRIMYGSSLELVHRIDRFTSGCLLIAKRRLALKHLQTQLISGDIHKQYWALLKDAWQKKQHKIDAPLLKNTNTRHHKVSVDNEGSSALSYFQPMKNIHFEEQSVSVNHIVIKTGRMHQIRVHANYANHPVVGDDRYGDDAFNYKLKKLGVNRLCLHAMQLKFINPATEAPQSISAPIDEVLLDKINALSKMAESKTTEPKISKSKLVDG